MSKRAIVAVVSSVVFLFIACDDDGIISEGAAFHFPLFDGNYWVYITNSEDYYPDHTLSCGSKVEYGSFRAWRITRQFEYSQETFYWDLDEDGLYEYLSVTSRSFRLIAFPIDVGMTWSSGIDGYTVACYAKESVVTPTSEFTDCYKIGYEGDGGVFECYWYKPDIGLVKTGRGDSIDNITEFVYLDTYNIN
ncbi:MAG: hypothetical protein GY771_09460 [bacterium]|nr:hypothetical protein [bacterium]